MTLMSKESAKRKDEVLGFTRILEISSGMKPHSLLSTCDFS